MSVAIALRERRVLGKSLGVAAVITLAFAAPATVRLAIGRLAPDESRLGDAIASALGGITLPIVAAATAVAVLGVGSPLRAHADRRVAAGATPRSVVGRMLAITIAAATLASAFAGALTILLLRLSLKLGAPSLLVFDMGATAWGAILGAAAWTALASAFVIRSGRAGLAWIVIGIDLLTRLIPGALAWIAPSAHVGNVLGAPPPRGFVHVPAIPQLASVAVLLVLAGLSAVVAARRYQGVPPR